MILFFLSHTLLVSELTLYSFAPFLWNAIHLNTASLLYAVHGSLTPFPLVYYRHLL